MSKLIYHRPAKDWNEALPIGNGSLGAMIFGDVEQERIHLNQDTLWSGFPKKIGNEQAYDAYLEARQKTFEGDYVSANRIVKDRFLDNRTEIYLPFGDLVLDYGIRGEAQEYKRVLDLSKAVMTVTFRVEDVEYKKEYLASFPDEVVAIRVSANKSGKVGFRVSMESQLKTVAFSEQDTCYLEGECPGFSFADEEKRFILRYEYSEKPEEKGVLFRGGVKVVNTGGTVKYSDKEIEVNGADSAVILWSAKTSFNGYDKFPAIEGKEYKNALWEILRKAEQKNWTELFDSHQKDYGKLYQKICLDLGSSGREEMPTDERLKLFNQDHQDISFYTLMFDYGRYLTIASSREGSQATNLQGIWNASMFPPWNCNYTVNINTEMNYWPTLMCGLKNCYEPLIRFMQERCEAGKYTAKSFYHAGGFVIHHNSDIWGYTAPVGISTTSGFWNGASGWFCHHLYDYYEYTMDSDYLKEICYPIMKEAARFYLDILCDRGDGHLAICPSTSPENTFYAVGDQMVAVCKYAIMSNTIVYELFENCIRAMEILGMAEEEFRHELESALDQIEPFSIGKDGRMDEWNEQFRETQPDHRHLSHLYALHPAHMITPEKTPEFAESCRKSLEVRGDEGSGWSRAWKTNLYARLNDGNHALEVMKKQLEFTDFAQMSVLMGAGTYANLLSAQPPFQIDGNFGLVSGILEMLADVRDGKLVLLPALPDEWKDGSLKGMRIKGNKVIDIEWKDGKVTAFEERYEEE